MEATSRTSASPAGSFARFTLHQAIVSQTKKPHCCEQAASSYIQFNKQGNDMKVYVTRIYNRKVLNPFTLQFFEEEIDGFQHLGRKLGINPTELVKKAVIAGLPLVVKSLEAKNKKQNTNKG